MTLKVFESKKIERSTKETINYKLEWLVIIFLSLVFTVICRVSQYSEIERVFVIKTDAGAFRFQMLMIASFLVLWIFFGFVLWIIFELGRWKHESCVRFIKFFLLYFSIQCVVLFLVWPGIFKQDELYLLFYTIADIRVVWVQSLFTQMFYWLAISMFPYVASLTFFQIVIISILAAATLKIIWDNICHKRLTYILLIPFLLLPVLDNNQFNIRNSQIAWFYLFLFVSIYYEYNKNNSIKIKKACFYLFLATMIGAWKTEFLYLLPCLFILIIVTNYKRDRWKSLAYIPYIIVIYLLLTLPNRLWQSEEDSYIMTAVMTPLSDVIASHLDDYDTELEPEFAKINEWIPLEEIKEDAIHLGTPMVYFEKGIVKNKEQVDELFLASLRILIHYPDEYLQNRIDVYMGTNGMIANMINHGDVSDWKQAMDIDGEDFYNYYFRYTNLGHSDLREKVITFLACRDQNNYVHTNYMYPVFYNSTWSFIILSIIIIGMIIKKKWFNSVLYAIVVLQVPLIAMFAPSIMFMYYMPFYLTSYVFIFNELILFLDKNKK